MSAGEAKPTGEDLPVMENEDGVRRLARDARRAVREGPEAIARRQRARLAELVA
ncbi:MAG: hypothetical protein HOW71_26260, partial [Nonomuraea sp.]|nr:hypothetical protein [Nonomuraea sp.]